MIKSSNSKIYDLEERTTKFAKNCRDFVNKLPKSITNNEYARQLARSSSSIGANYIEANESLSRKDFFHRVRISRKEAKESRLWLGLCLVGKSKDLADHQKRFIQESVELTKIFGAIVEKSKHI